MSIFNKIGDNISKAGKDVSQKAKDMSKINDLNGKMKNAKKKIDEVYFAIGRATFAQFEDGDKTNDFETECQSIATLLLEIKKHEKEILHIKNIKKCIGCGKGERFIFRVFSKMDAFTN